MLTEAMMSARKPKILASTPPQVIAWMPTASRAPTTITEEIAFVTLMSGVCSAG